MTYFNMVVVVLWLTLMLRLIHPIVSHRFLLLLLRSPQPLLLSLGPHDLEHQFLRIIVVRYHVFPPVSLPPDSPSVPPDPLPACLPRALLGAVVIVVVVVGGVVVGEVEALGSGG